MARAGELDLYLLFECEIRHFSEQMFCYGIDSIGNCLHWSIVVSKELLAEMAPSAHLIFQHEFPIILRLRCSVNFGSENNNG